MTEQGEAGGQIPNGEGLGDRVIKGTTDAVLGWWERVGPKRVEDQWVAAHQRVLDAMPDDDQRKKVFKLSAERWRKTGASLGAAATAIDFSLAGVGLWLSVRGLTTDSPDNIAYRVRFATSQATDQADKIIHWFEKLVSKNAYQKSRIWNAFFNLDQKIFFDPTQNKDHVARRRLAGRLFSFIPGMGAVGIAAGAGPAHAVGSLAARAAEGMEKRAFKPT